MADRTLLENADVLIDQDGTLTVHTFDHHLRRWLLECLKQPRPTVRHDFVPYCQVLASAGELVYPWWIFPPF